MTALPDTALTRTTVICAGVRPTIAALLVAVRIIEWLQVDWTVSCELVSNAPQSCPPILL
jgi:hypothetical protein